MPSTEIVIHFVCCNFIQPSAKRYTSRLICLYMFQRPVENFRCDILRNSNLASTPNRIPENPFVIRFEQQSKRLWIVLRPRYDVCFLLGGHVRLNIYNALESIWLHCTLYHNSRALQQWN